MNVRTTTLLVTAVSITLLFVADASALGRFQQGIEITNELDLPIELEYSWSIEGKPPGDPGWCLDDLTIAIQPGESAIVLPRPPFQITDFTIYYLGVGRPHPNLGGMFLLDPPGLGSITFSQPADANGVQPLYSYAQVGGSGFGPVTAIVPIVENGFEPSGVPKLFAAVVDPNTGRPVPNTRGEGHCLTPTSTRVNDPITGQILPAYRFSGETEPSVTVTIPPPGQRIPAVSTWGLVILGLLILLAGVALLHRSTAAGSHTPRV